MKKKIAYLLALLFVLTMSSIVLAQATHTVDFEPGGVGADWNWSVSENADNPPLEFIGNPVSGGINTTPTVAKFIARQAGNPWALFFTSDDGEFTFDANNSMVKIMVYKPVISDVGFKVEGGTGPATELKVPNTVTNAWEELTFDFSSLIGNTYNRLVIIPDFAERSQDNTIYIDNIQVPDGIVIQLPEPTFAAPTPILPANEVISIFSDVYDDLAGTDFNPNWGQSTAVSQVLIQGDTTLLYEGLNYQGTQLANPQDLSAMKYMHVDFWTANSTALAVYLISQSTGEKSYSFTIVNESWVCVDIPLTHFTDQGLSVTDIHQLKFDGNGTIYLDNLYFSSRLSAAPNNAAPIPTAAPGNVISLFSNAYTNVPVDTWSAGWDQADVADVQIAGDDVKLYTNLAFAGIEFTSQTVDATAMTHFHIDIWTPDPTASPAVFKIKLVDFGADGAWSGGDDVEHELVFDAASTPALQTGTWVSFDIPLSNFTGLTTKAHLAQLIISGDPNTVYVDNVYFYTSGTDVKDIFSGIPSDYALEQNYPNPFNPMTSIRFSLPKANHVTLKVYNMLGQEITTLMDEFMNAGIYDVKFDAAALPTGMYVYSISANGFTSVKKMMLVK